MKPRLSRRALLRKSVAGAAGLVVLAGAASARTFKANEKLNIALIGVGGRGKAFVGSMPNSENVVALCDVSDKKATVALRKFPKLPRYHDYRKMFDEMARQIDAVVVATPDHSHAPASAAAIKAGKGVYCEKPLTRTVAESRALRDLARKHKVATSMGNQGTAGGQFRRALELIRDGTIGTIKEVHTWNDQGGHGWKTPPEGEAKIPYYLKWDLWLGPAAYRPFHPKWMAWHGWRDFGTANLGNWASHSQNLAFMALKVDSLWSAEAAAKPIVRVEAKVDEVYKLSFPRWEHVRWDIPARGSLPRIAFHWHNGSTRPGVRKVLEEFLGRPVNWGPKNWSDWAGSLIVGTEGKILATAHNATFVILPAEKFKGVEKGAPRKVDRSAGHERDWLNACRGGKPAWANFDYAGPLTEFNMLGNVATQFPGVLEFDPLACKIVNNQAADSALRSEYRKGWSL